MTSDRLLKFRIILVIIAITAFSYGCKKNDEIPVVKTGTVSDITDISATITGNTINSAKGNIYNRGLCWSNNLTEPNINEDNQYVEGFGDGSFTIYLGDLTPGTKYYVRAYATNSAGTGYGDVVSFTTTGTITGDIVFNPDLTYGTVTDTLGNQYKTIQIGTQTWMAENLKTTRLNDYTEIANITGFTEWQNFESPAYCWYLNDTKYTGTFGALYNYYTVNTGKLCPTGWHVPGYEEWSTLFNYLGTTNNLGNLLRESGTTHWMVTSTDVKNSTGFTALPGGWRNIESVNFSDMGYSGCFWAIPENDSKYNNVVFLFQGTWEGILFSEQTSKFGSSVRCVKN